jgi:hypothetical protein
VGIGNQGEKVGREKLGLRGPVIGKVLADHRDDRA